LTQCREEEQAEELKEFKMWWDLILTMPVGGLTPEHKCA